MRAQRRREECVVDVEGCYCIKPGNILTSLSVSFFNDDLL